MRKIQAIIYSVELFKEILECLGISDIYPITNRVYFFLNKVITKINNKSKNVRIIVLTAVLTFNHYRYTCASAPMDLQSPSTDFLLQHTHLPTYSLKANTISVCLSFVKVCSPFIFFKKGKLH